MVMWLPDTLSKSDTTLSCSELIFAVETLFILHVVMIVRICCNSRGIVHTTYRGVFSSPLVIGVVAGILLDNTILHKGVGQLYRRRSGFSGDDAIVENTFQMNITDGITCVAVAIS